jgi:serine/threonine-protein kinase
VITFSRAVTERYEIKQSIGRGGMAEVFLAIDRSLQRRVALKVLSPVLVGDERAVEYFRREARSVAALNHPGIVTIYDVGVLDGRPFICMELIDGRDLDARLTEEGPLPLSTAVDMAINICSSLEYAHNRNVIHRDIKPPNIMLLNEGGYKILDFGLAKAIQVERRNQTMVAGTPEYMAPEQLAGAELDGRADLFAFGVTFYESLTNYFPFEGALRTNDIYPPSALVHAIPKELDQIVLRCLALDPSDRFGRAGEVAERLRRIPLVVNR